MTITVPMRKVTEEMTAMIVVTGYRAYSVRVWLAIRALRMAAWIMPVKTEIEVKS